MKILILANSDEGLYNFRKELLIELLKEHEVLISVPEGEYVSYFRSIGCKICSVSFDRHGTNPLEELELLSSYKKLLKEEKPDIVFTYTIKPNVYGGMTCAQLGVPYVANITGLGTAIENGGIMQKITLILYKLGLRKAQKVFFQNKKNMQFMLDKKIVSKDCCHLLPGSGVNLIQHCFEEYPEESDQYIFVTIGRLMKEKGTDEILYAAKRIKEEYPNTVFQLIGSYDGNYEEKIRKAEEEGIVEFLGSKSDVHAYIKRSHATIHASYHEGMSNVLLESAACGRPVIATDVPGCQETFDNNISGISFKERDGEALIKAVRDFLELPYERKIEMGKEGRKKMEREFDRANVIEAYMNELKMRLQQVN